MILTDSHVHFDTFFEPNTYRETIDRAKAADVCRMIAVGGSADCNARAIALAEEFPDTIGAVIGYDRDEADKHPDLDLVERKLSLPQVVGVGETGLDYHYSPDTVAAQKQLFAAMLKMAAAHELPVVVHSREADDDTYDLLSSHVRTWQGSSGRVGVLHCFTGSFAFAERILDLGLMISFSGIITFKNAGDLRDVAARVPDDQLLIETDTPYLTPVPFRGKPNEPSFVRHVAQQIAEIRHCSLEDIASITTRNAERLFRQNDQEAGAE